MRARATMVVAAMAIAATVLAGAGAQAVPTAAGFTVTIQVPDAYDPGVPFTVTGRLMVAFALPILVEVGAGVPDEEIVVLVDGQPAGTAITDDEGAYAVELVFDALPPTTRELQAVAYEGSALETRSRVAETRLRRILSELWIEPGSATVAQGGTVQLSAVGMWDDGRTDDLSAQASWTSSDETVATVDDDGTVTGVSSGEVTITAEAHDKTATAAVGVTT